MISLFQCSIQNRDTILLSSFSWKMRENEAWLIIGPNGGGKSAVASAIADLLEIIPENGGHYTNRFSESVCLVSFETAAATIEKERKEDDSDFIEGGIDDGRLVKNFITENLSMQQKTAMLSVNPLSNHPLIITCGIAQILDRGIKYLSTGELRRSLLCRALLTQPELLIIDEPFEGLDTASRLMMSELLETIACDNVSSTSSKTHLLLLMDRFESVPPSINQVLELFDRKISFTGTRKSYEALLLSRIPDKQNQIELQKKELETQLEKANTPSNLSGNPSVDDNQLILVKMINVTVEWSERKVLDNLSWTLKKGEHWLIRGPNGSGKTTFLELITGDNPQVFRNEVYLFGSKRGSGETIWELKEKMGIVSYRLHLDYRSLGDFTLEEVLLSGIHDSIGLYTQSTHEQALLAEQWLYIAGFGDQPNLCFRDLSYGEQRALLIARAAIKSPQLLILDEPCHGLDETHRIRILLLLEAIAAKGISTLLHVTHDPAEMLSCTKHVLELLPGETPMYRILITPQ